MSTVATNDKLHDRVESITKRYLGQERQRLEHQFLRHLPETGDSIYAALVGQDHIDWTHKAPDNMFNMADKVTIVTLGQSHIALDLSLDRPVASPMKTVAFAGGTMESGYRTLSLKLDGEFPAWQPYIAAAEALSTKRGQIVDDIHHLNRFVLKLFREHKSLGPVLRMWPPLWDILHDDDRRRQGAKPYGAKLPIPSHIGDEAVVNKMTALVVRIKMASR